MALMIRQIKASIAPGSAIPLRVCHSPSSSLNSIVAGFASIAASRASSSSLVCIVRRRPYRFSFGWAPQRRCPRRPQALRNHPHASGSTLSWAHLTVAADSHDGNNPAVLVLHLFTIRARKMSREHFEDQLIARLAPHGQRDQRAVGRGPMWRKSIRLMASPRTGGNGSTKPLARRRAIS